MAFHMNYISFSSYCSFRLLVFFACRKHIQDASQLVWLLVNSHAFHVPYFLTFGDCPHHILKKFLCRWDCDQYGCWRRSVNFERPGGIQWHPHSRDAYKCMSVSQTILFFSLIQLICI